MYIFVNFIKMIMPCLFLFFVWYLRQDFSEESWLSWNSEYQAVLELGDVPASASWVLRLKTCTTTPTDNAFLLPPLP